MDSLTKKLFKELEEMQQQTGRMLRNMSITRMMPFESGSNQPPVDVYEAEGEICVYLDIAGADRESLSVVADDQHVRVSGRRELPAKKSIACIHQLELELGTFDRTISLPSAVEVDEVTSSYKDGILTVILPKKQMKGRINVQVSGSD